MKLIQAGGGLYNLDYLIAVERSKKTRDALVLRFTGGVDLELTVGQAEAFLLLPAVADAIVADLGDDQPPKRPARFGSG